MTEEELHSATDLALYIVNTRELYSHAQGIMRQRVKGKFSDALWVGHVKVGRQLYEKELNIYNPDMYKEEVIKEAASQVRDHYSDEQSELGKGNV